MKLNAHWPSVLEAARAGDLEPARAARQFDPAGTLADYFYARALAEADTELDEALTLLRAAHAAEPVNPMILHTLALALLRSGAAGEWAEADAIWKKHGLPHDLDLLGQVALTLEALGRPWPEHSAAADLPWPTTLPLPPTELPQPADTPAVIPLGEAAGPSPAEGVKMSPSGATKTSRSPGRRRLTRAANRLEYLLLKHQSLQVLEQAGALLDEGLESAELHVVAGLAAEEAGEPRRARAHLARACQMEPALLAARMWLARVYWREGWFELALALGRSLPVEGPYDYGRHYHLALAHAGLGERSAALRAMHVALTQFYLEAREFYIERALVQWRTRRLAPTPATAQA